MKRIVSLILALSMVLSMFTFSFAGESLKDVAGTKYQAAVEALIELDIVDGYPDETYLPENKITRAELSKLLVIAYGLLDAAEVAGSTTPFTDANNHWASGYVNVSADYKFVNGYPDGSFQPNETVTYAEAITMCLRVLGYANEIDAKGTWPSNYVAKAKDLKLLRDIEYNSINDGATRGNVALLIWNMLRTKMWAVTSESEGDGLVSAPKDIMLEVKFPDYLYNEEMTFRSWSYNEDEAKVYVSLSGEGKTLEYAKNDFYTLVPGTEVSALYKKNNKENKLLSVVPTEDNVLVNGSVADLEEKYTNYENEGDTYAYLLLDANKKAAVIEGKVEFNGADSEYVTKVEKKSDYTKVTTATKSYSIDDEEKADILVIHGEERLSLADLKAGDVITWIAENVAILSRETVEGSFESLTTEDVADDYREFIKLDGKEYEGIEDTLTIAKVNEDDEEVFDSVEKSALLPKKNDYLGEDATLFFNFIGEVVRMEFGVVDVSDIKGDFFLVTTGSIWSVADEEGATWYIKLANEDGVDSYKFEEGKEDEIDLVAGTCYWVEFNDDDEIEAAYDVASSPASAEDFTFASIGSKMDDDNYIGENKVMNSTKVFTVRQLEDEDGELMDKYELIVTEGPKKLEGITEGTIALIKDSIKVAYAFVSGESTSADKEYGIVEKYYVEAGIKYVVVNTDIAEDRNHEDMTYELAGSSDVPTAGSIIAYTLDSKDRLRVAFEYGIDEITGANKVTKVDGDLVTVEGLEKPLDLSLVAKPENYEDYRVFNVEIGYKNGEARFENIVEGDIEDMSVRKDDALAETKEDAPIDAIVILRGMDWQ